MLKRFKNTQSFIAAFLLMMPFVLRIFEGEFRPSISDYYNTGSTNLYTLLLAIAGTMFIYSGSVRDKWYNIVLGFSLFVVGLTNHETQEFLHFGAAGLFFVGSVAAIIVYSSAKQRFIKIVAAAVVLFAMMLHFVFDYWSLLVAEWIGLLPISLHFIGESQGKID